MNFVLPQVCSSALLNLLTPDNLERLVNEDLVQATAALSKKPLPPKNDDEKLLRVCAEIFCLLSQNEYGRSKLGKRATLVNIFGLTRSKDRTTQVLLKICFTRLNIAVQTCPIEPVTHTPGYLRENYLQFTVS